MFQLKTEKQFEFYLFVLEFKGDLCVNDILSELFHFDMNGKTKKQTFPGGVETFEGTRSMRLRVWRINMDGLIRAGSCES